MRALEEHLLAVAQRRVDQKGGVRDVRAQPLGVLLRAPRQLVELDRIDAVDALQPEVLLGERDLDLLAQDLRVEQVLHADTQPVGLVRVGRADPASRRPDLELAEPPLARLVDGQVPGHDEVRVPGQAQPLGREAAALEVVEFLAEAAGVDDAAGADDAFLAGEDARGQVPQLVGLVADEDGVPGVRPAVVAADDVRVLGEQVDDLALALVSPLRAHDDRGWHDRSVPRPSAEVGVRRRPARG